jgi:sulfate permease, SulP family
MTDNSTTRQRNPSSAVRRLGGAAADGRLAWRGDLLGGLTAGVLTLVTAISYSAVAGAPLGAGLSSAAVLAGLIGAALGGLVACLLAPAAPQVFSPRASVAVVVASAAATLAAQFGTSPQALGATLGWLTITLLLAALFQAGFGLLRLGGVIRMMPHAVTAGFTIGLAIELALAQLPHLLPSAGVGGGPSGLAGYAPAAVAAVVVAVLALAHRRGWDGWAMPLGLAAGIAASALLRWLPSAPAIPMLQAVNLDATALVSLGAALNALRTGVSMPVLSTVMGLAFVIAFVNSVETLTSSLAVEDATQRRLDANRALVAAAAGSLAAVCAGGLPVAGSAATSLAAVHAGARSRRAMVVAAFCVAVLAALTHRWIDLIALSVVAALMLSVALTLARAPWNELALLVHEARDPRRAWGEVLLALLVCALLVGVGPVAALVGGVVAGGAVAAAQMRGQLVRRRYDADHPSATALLATPLPAVLARRIEIIEIGQPLLFATVESAVQVIEGADAHAEVIVLDLTLAGTVDASALRTLARSGEALAASGRRLVLVGSALARPLDRLREDYAVFDTLSEALAHSASLMRQSSASSRVASALATYAGGRGMRSDANDRVETTAAAGALRETPPVADRRDEDALSDAAVQRAVQDLKPYVGPVAYALVSQARQSARNRAELYRLLARRHLRRAADRHAFLSAAGMTGSQGETAG